MINITVGSIVEKEQPIVEHSLSLRGRVEKMTSYSKGYVVILQSGKAVGIITERDILNIADQKIDYSKNCLDYVTRGIISVSEDRSIYFAVNFWMTVSIGVGLFPDDGDSLKEILRKADERLYRAKNSKNTVVYC